jgi:hypothetical protein
MRHITRAACAALMMAATCMAAVPLRAAAVTQIPEGGGPLSLTLSTTSTGLPPLAQACITMSVSGTGAWTVAGADATGTYAGPVTVTGSYQACGSSALDTGWIALTITGNALFGDLSCSSAPIGPGVWDRVGASVITVVPVSCEIGGVQQARTNLVFAAAAAPLSVDSSGGLDAYITAGEVQFAI